ncbi:MAG: glycosyltransferase family 9 protein [Gemmataceae bacterium]|nr:glycosyltransferase family 9 protein [Gemmataceae bacterium]MDW8243714.1 glycosyltransferase family 9 protein [Thermogemmata sp.]
MGAREPLARLRGPRLPAGPPQRIALIKPSALGDIVHALPVLTGLRLLYPSARISWVVNASYAPLLEGHPHLDGVVPFERGLFRRGCSLWQMARYLWQWGRELRQQQFDLVIDLQGLLRSGLMTWASGAAVRIGFARSREASVLAYTHRVWIRSADRLHAVERYWQVVRVLGGDDLPLRFVVPLRPAERAAALALWQQLPRPWLAVAPGARWLTKRWPAASFAALINRWHQHSGGGCLLLGARDDIPTAHQVARHVRGPLLDLTGQTTLRQLVALIAGCDFFVGNDSGPLHLAAALSKPCLAPYTCTQPRWHGPYTFPHGAVATRVPCAGSYRKRCPSLECHRQLTAEELWQHLEQKAQPWLRPSRLPAA